VTPPVRRNQFKLADFAAYLAKHGAEVGAPTNPYEVIRYRAFWQGSAKAVTHIVYTKENGLLTYMGGARQHYQAFLDGDDLPDTQEEADTAKRAGRIQRSQSIRTRLLARDGDECWFCGDALGEDCTIEHLIPRVAGGTNALVNLALAHGACNRKADDWPLARKLELRASLRASAMSAGTAETQSGSGRQPASAVPKADARTPSPNPSQGDTP
jgi:hypothetical protein